MTSVSSELNTHLQDTFRISGYHLEDNEFIANASYEHMFHIRSQIVTSLTSSFAA